MVIPPSRCWKMKHGSFSHLPDLQAKKVVFFPVVNMFLADLVSAILLVRKFGTKTEPLDLRKCQRKEAEVMLSGGVSADKFS